MHYLASAFRAAIRFISTCVDCGARIPADQAWCPICASK